MKKSFVFCAVLIFSFCAVRAFADDEKSVIKIESAQKTEYKKDAEGGGDSIILTGGVVVSVTRGSKTTTIKAERVNYNRGKDMLYAEGSVSLTQSSGGTAGGETVNADSLLFNTATLEGIFDKGRAVQTSSDALNLPSGSKLIVSSDMFGRDNGGTIAFKSGNLTFCDDENPHWKIRATRIWLLPGGEFAFLNAVLFVGRVPLLWLPAFYYPKDELIFNPAFGYEARRGYYFNTTTYLYGRKVTKKKDSSSDSDDDKINFFSLMNTSSMKEQKREGLVLHNLDADYKGNTTNYAKIEADYYANLGIMAGFDMNLSPGENMTSLLTTFELGFSKTVFKNNGVYLPYNSAGDEVKDSATLLGFYTPFRYRANLKMVFAKPLTLTLSLPVYSDPYFVDDFGTRVESMDWIEFAMNGTDDSEDESEEITEISSFTWSLTGNKTFEVPKKTNPYISSLALSSFSSSVVFSSKATDTTELKNRSEYKADNSWLTYTPERKFYYPSQVTPLNASGKIGGTIFKIPADKKSSTTGEKVSLSTPYELKSDEERQKEKESKESKESKEKKNDEDAKKSDEKTENSKMVFDEKAFPSLTTPTFSVRTFDTFSYSLGYTISPDFTSQLTYASTNLYVPADFEWSDVQSTYINVKSPIALSSALSWKDGFVSLTDSLTFEPVYQSHPYLKELKKDSDGNENGGYTESSVTSIENADKSARKLDLTSVNALSVKPFTYTEHFSSTALTWNTTMKLIKTEYEAGDETAGTKGAYSFRTAEFWNDDCFTVHNLSATLAAKEGDFSQSLVLTSTLPPVVDAYHGALTLGFPYVSLTAGTGIKQKSKDDETWVKEDFVQSATVSILSSKLKFTQSYTYDLEEEENESFKLGLTGYGATISYTMSNVAGYEFNVTKDDSGKIIKRNGWKAKSSDDKKFQPYQLSVSYTNPSKTFKYVGERISFAPGVSTSLVYDFLRPTNSYLSFKPSITFKINEFLNLTFSAESRNSVIYRYFCPEDDYEFYYAGNGERSFWQDLVDSFRFDSDEKRMSSGFKMKSVAVTVTHDLDDWDFNCSFKMSPRYITDEKRYDFSPYFSLSVAWRPLSGMKTEIVDEYGTWKLNP